MFNPSSLAKTLGVSLVALLPLHAAAFAQDGGAATQGSTPTMEGAAAKITADIRDAEAELSALRERATAEILPLSAELRALEAELGTVSAELKAATRDQSDANQQLSLIHI